ncbi:MAG: hypothetical protein P1U52_12005 [Porticoccaceae bacterium]|nr:hypothetical protein [Porticoccaceae bacterium]
MKIWEYSFAFCFLVLGLYVSDIVVVIMSSAVRCFVAKALSGGLHAYRLLTALGLSIIEAH